MLYALIGDREKARAALDAALASAPQKGLTRSLVRLSDASSGEDLRAALSERGMFDVGLRTVVLDGLFASPELRALVEDLLPAAAKSEDRVYVLEEKPDAAAKRFLEKHAADVKKFEAAAKKKSEDNFFALAGALQKGDKKQLWLLLRRELAAGKAPEAVHGILFWAAKQLVLKPRAGSDEARGRKLVALLAELPHEARRQGEDMDYALERFVLSGA